MQNDNSAKDLKNVNDGKVTSNKSSHPIGTALGVAGGAVAGVAGSMIAGAAAGAVVGPAGAAIGAAVGGVIGAMTGHEIAAQVNPKEEDLYWRANYSNRPYVKADSDYATYQPAYNYGVESYTKHNGKSFDAIEADLGSEWGSKRGNSTLDWDEAKPAAQDAYTRVDSSSKI